MSLFVVPFAAVLWILLSASLALPWLALWERLCAARTGRSFYDKAALQISSLAFWSQLAFFVLLGADWLANGAIRRFASPIWSPLDMVLPVELGLAMLASLLAVLCMKGKRPRPGMASASLVTGGLLGLVAMFAAWLLLWFLARALTPDRDVTLSLTMIIRLIPFAGVGWWMPLTFLAAAVMWGVAAAHGLSLCWHLIRRNADDYGRDYYLFAVGRRARLAMLSGALALVPSGVLLALAPALSGSPSFLDTSLFPCTTFPMFWVWRAGTLGLLLTVFCWYRILRADVPTRKKFLILLAPILLMAGFCSLLAHLWVLS